MATKVPVEQNNEMERRKDDSLNALIGEQVIHKLGMPLGLYDVQVRRLWEDRYRVNVIMGETAASPRIANSFFVKADSGGKIVESNPTIKKLY